MSFHPLANILKNRRLIFLMTVINTSQYGFLKNKSTEIDVSDFTNEILKSLDDMKFIIGTHLDLSKAFGTVNYSILLPNWKASVLQALLLHGFHHSSQIENSMLILIRVPFLLTPLPMGYLKVQCDVHPLRFVHK